MTSTKIPFRHIAVEGPIGVGKTSLVERLAQRFEGVMVLEDITNPFLASFYEGREGAAFQVQIYFLLSRFQQQREIAQMNLFQRLVLADYTFPKDRIFAYLNLDDTDLRVYEKLYPVLEQEVPTPDLVIYMQASVEVLEELLGLRFPALTMSAETGDGVDALGPFLFQALEVVRVYTKTPGKPADTDKPFTLRHGDTVHDLASLVHKDIAEGLKFARMWGADVFDGQQVGPEHLVADGDVVELHAG